MEAAPEIPVRPRVKISAYLVAWLLALFATNPSGALWSLAWMFPLGLVAVFYPPGLREQGWVGMLTCYAFYIIHGHFFFRTKTRRSIYLWYAALIVILICNVSGCRSMLSSR